MADKGNDSGEEEEATIAEDVVVTKYKMAGDMANRKWTIVYKRILLSDDLIQDFHAKGFVALELVSIIFFVYKQFALCVCARVLQAFVRI